MSKYDGCYTVQSLEKKEKLGIIKEAINSLTSVGVTVSPTQGQRMVELGELGTVTYGPMGEASDEGVGQRVLLLTEDKRRG